MIKILITGANGFVGGSLVKKLILDPNIKVIPYYRHSNLNDIKKIKPDYIIHCAAEIYKEELMINSNILLTYKLLEICKNIPIKNFVYIGSSSEYGRKNHPIKESDILEPETLYEGTKACGTMLTKVYGKSYGFNTSIVRPFSVYGPGEAEKKLIPHLYKLFVNNQPAKIKPGVHDWIYIDDFIEGIKQTMLLNTIPGEIYHFGTGIQYSNLDVLNIFSTLFNKNIKYTITNDISSSAGVDSECWVADISKVKKVLEWKPQYTLKEGIKKYIEYKNGIN